MQLAAAAMVISTVASAAGSIMSGNAEASASRFQARQMNQQADQERAASQRVALEQRRQAGLAISRANAVGAASGAGGTDIENIEADLAGEGEYNALSALYQGEERARGLQMGAGARLYEGANAKRAGLMGAGTGILKGAGDIYKSGSMKSDTIMDSGTSLLDKYGDGGFSDSNGLYLNSYG